MRGKSEEPRTPLKSDSWTAFGGNEVLIPIPNSLCQPMVMHTCALQSHGWSLTSLSMGLSLDISLSVGQNRASPCVVCIIGWSRVATK